MRPRYTLVNLPFDEKLREKERLMGRIQTKRIEFRDGQAAFTETGAEVVQNVAEVLLDYPELDVVVEGFTGRLDSKRKTKEDPDKLGIDRAEAAREQLATFGVISDIRPVSKGFDARAERGYVTITPGQAKLLNPQQRLDMILSRYSFDFAPQTSEMSAKGQRVAAVMARVMKETRHRVLITVPKRSSALAIKRAEAIAQAIRDTGVITEVVVKIAVGNQDRATVTIDDKLPTSSPQGQLMDILKETPLAFRPNAADLVPDVLPVVKRCAEVLKQVKYMTCLVEAYSGHTSSRSLEVNDQRLRAIMLERAQRVVDMLQDEGVTVPIYAKGYNGAASDGNAGRGPRVVLTLVNQGEEELEPIEVTESDYGGCVQGGVGCIWDDSA